jgi:hypothetical protein
VTDDLEFVLARLDATPASDLTALAAASGIPEGTLSKIKYRVTKDPGYSTVKTLREHYRDLDRAARAARAVKKRRNGHAVRAG